MFMPIFATVPYRGCFFPIALAVVPSLPVVYNVFTTLEVNNLIGAMTKIQ